VIESLEKEMMARALNLAARARGRTSPNPMVGAVIFKEGRVVGEGYHRRCGLSHAERAALRQAGSEARGAVLAVNLEPCSHYGRMPPCVEAIIEAGVARVVVAMLDPNPLVRGRGIYSLRRAGIEVEVGVLGDKARLLNEVFIHHITTGRPFAALKLAQSLDGGIALRSGVQTPISSSPALALKHILRSWHDAVMVGISTVEADDPLLNVRGRQVSRQPWRVVLDSSLRISAESKLVESAGEFPTLVLYDPALASDKRIEALRRRSVELVPIKAAGEGFLSPESVLDALASHDITSVLIEGGRRVATSFLARRLIQRLHLFIAPVLMGGGKALHALGEIGASEEEGSLRLEKVERKFMGADIYLTGRIAYPGR